MYNNVFKMHICDVRQLRAKTERKAGLVCVYVYVGVCCIDMHADRGESPQTEAVTRIDVCLSRRDCGHKG